MCERESSPENHGKHIMQEIESSRPSNRPIGTGCLCAFRDFWAFFYSSFAMDEGGGSFNKLVDKVTTDLCAPSRLDLRAIADLRTDLRIRTDA